MRKMFSKKLLLVSSLVIGVSYGILWACAGGDWDEYGVSAFAPEAFVDSAYKPFFYSDQFYYEIGHDEQHVERFNNEIVKEWKMYLGESKKSDTEVSFFLLKANAELVADMLKKPTGSLPPNIASMQLVKNKSAQKNTAFFEFLTYAKANESYAATSYSYWEYDESAKPKPFSQQQLNDRVAMEKKMKNAPDDFMAQRYFFQLVRSYFFSADYVQCIDFYEKNKSRFKDNILAARTLSYVAGAFYKQKKYAMANYLYSKVYDAGTLFKTVAHFSFHPQDDSDWKQTLALCQNKDEQASLWHLLGIYFDESRAIKEIYKLDPKSEKLDLLLTRLVNLQEIQSNTSNTEYGGGNYRPGKDSLNKNALVLVSSIADAGNTSKPYLWLLSAGYLHFINEEYAKAQAYYSKAQKTMPKDELAQAQIRLFVLMNNVAGTTKLDKERASFLLNDLLWLQSVSNGSIPSFRCSYAYEWIKNTLSQKYKKQNDELLSELFVHRDTFYTNPAMVLKMKTFLINNKNNTPFEQYCSSIYAISIADISEYQYVSLAYQDRIEEALALIKASDSVNDVELLGNPFNGNIKDCHDCDHAAPQKTKYTKISLLQKMKVMEDNVAAGNDVYNNGLLLGNAFYNMSHYGNARYFYEGAIIGSGQSSPVMLSSSFSKMLLQQDLAKRYYQKALAAASTEEQKAKVTYLLLKCQRNELYNKLYDNPDYNSWDYADVPAINFAALLPYRNTKYYQDVISECGYFRTYVSKRK